MRVPQHLLSATLLTLLLVSYILAQPNKDSKLFQTFPLHSHLNTLFSESRFHSFNSELSTAIQQALHIEEQQKIEQITRSLGDEKKNKEVQNQKSIFHTYDAEALAIYGTADIEFLKNFLKDENYKPIFLQNSNKGMVTLWIINHKDTSLGSYKQLMITVSVANKKMGYNLGVTYDGNNAATFIFPSFGKLQNHARLFVMKSVYDRELNRKFGQQVNGLDGELGSGKIERTQETDSSYMNFLFTDEAGNLILEGKVEEDNSWSSYFTTAWKIFRALGLSGILDLWNAPHVALKTVGSSKSAQPKINSIFTDFKQHIHEWNDYKLKFGDSEIAKQLKDMNFEPGMVVRMPQFQYAMTSPRDQQEDNEYNQIGDLKFVDPEKAKEHLQRLQHD